MRHDLGRGWGAWDEGNGPVGPQGREGSQCPETAKPSPSPLPGGFMGTGPSPVDALGPLKWAPGATLAEEPH